jgi:uncharacterized protein (UPF0218 family)
MIGLALLAGLVGASAEPITLEKLISQFTPIKKLTNYDEKTAMAIYYLVVRNQDNYNKCQAHEIYVNNDWVEQKVRACMTYLTPEVVQVAELKYKIQDLLHTIETLENLNMKVTVPTGFISAVIAIDKPVKDDFSTKDGQFNLVTEHTSFSIGGRKTKLFFLQTEMTDAVNLRIQNQNTGVTTPTGTVDLAVIKRIVDGAKESIKTVIGLIAGAADLAEIQTILNNPGTGVQTIRKLLDDANKLLTSLPPA